MRNSDQKALFAKSGPMQNIGVILTPIRAHVLLFLLGQGPFYGATGTLFQNLDYSAGEFQIQCGFITCSHFTCQKILHIINLIIHIALDTNGQRDLKVYDLQFGPRLKCPTWSCGF